MWAHVCSARSSSTSATARTRASPEGSTSDEPHLPVHFTGRLDAFDRPQRGGDPAAKHTLQRLLTDELHNRHGDIPATRKPDAVGLDPAHLTIVNFDVPLPGLARIIVRNPPHATDHEPLPAGSLPQDRARRPAPLLPDTQDEHGGVTHDELLETD